MNFVYNNKFAVLVLRLSDESFNVLMENPGLLQNEGWLSLVSSENGNNVHMIKGYGDAMGLKAITKELKPNAKTITFFRDDQRLHTLYRRDS